MEHDLILPQPVGSSALLSHILLQGSSLSEDLGHVFFKTRQWGLVPVHHGYLYKKWYSFVPLFPVPLDQTQRRPAWSTPIIYYLWPQYAVSIATVYRRTCPNYKIMNAPDITYYHCKRYTRCTICIYHSPYHLCITYRNTFPDHCIIILCYTSYS